MALEPHLEEHCRAEDTPLSRRYLRASLGEPALRRRHMSCKCLRKLPWERGMPGILTKKTRSVRSRVLFQGSIRLTLPCGVEHVNIVLMSSKWNNLYRKLACQTHTNTFSLVDSVEDDPEVGITTKMMDDLMMSCLPCAQGTIYTYVL